MGKMKKRGYFFTLDVIIAMIIMVVGFILVWSNYVTQTEQRQPYFYAQDLLDFLSTATNGEVSTLPYVQSLFLDGNISDLSMPAIEQIASFYGRTILPGSKKWETEMVYNYTEAVTMDLVPEQFSFEITIDRMRVYNETGLSNRTQNQSDVLISAKKLVILVTDRTEISSPFLAEVKVWR